MPASQSTMYRTDQTDHVFDEKLDRCLVCDSSEIRDHKTDYRKVSIARCNACGFQFMNPQYEDNYIHQFYVDFYVDDGEFDEHLAQHAYGFDYYLRWVERYTQPGSLLDIGCGTGSMLFAALKRGWQVTGYDVDENSIRAVSERLNGTTVLTGKFLELDESQTYDAITMHQVLEHVKDPNETLEKVKRLLKPGGHLFMAVPNIMSFSNRTKMWMESAKIRRKKVGKYYDTFHHLLYFTPKTMRRMLSKHGFEILAGRNCHKSKAQEPESLRWLKHNSVERIFPSSAFFYIARKR